MERQQWYEDEDGKKDYTSVIPWTLHKEWKLDDRMNEWHMISGCEDPEDHRFVRTRKM